MQDFGELTGLIYEAALDPGLWPKVLEQIADRTGGDTAVLLYQNQTTKRGTGVPARIDTSVVNTFFGSFASRNPLTRHNNDALSNANLRLRTITDQMVLPKREYMQTDYYNDFMKPHGLHGSLMMGLSVDGANLATCNIMRPSNKPEFGEEEVVVGDIIRPHLARAFRLGMRLNELQQTGNALFTFLDRSQHGVFLLGGDGRLRHANRTAEDMLSRSNGLSINNGELQSTSRDVTRELQVLIAAAVLPGPSTRSGGSLSISRGPNRLPLSVIVAPVNRDSASLFAAGPAAIVCISDPEKDIAIPERRLRELFGLTPAECKVALELMAGHETKGIAERLGLRFNTVRVHVARILDKTQTNRQAELVRLMMRITGIYLD